MPCLKAEPSHVSRQPTALLSLPWCFTVRRFNSLFGRFNSLLDRLGNFPFESCKMNDLRVQIRSANCPQVDFSQYFPVLQGTKAGHRPPPAAFPTPGFALRRERSAAGLAASQYPAAAGYRGGHLNSCQTDAAFQPQP